MSALAQTVKALQSQHLEGLQDLLRIPSVSTDPSHAGDVRRAAEWVRARMIAAGCTRAELHDTPRHPIVYGEWLGAPGRPTILVYGHYDVQPVDPVAEWHTPPFEPTVRDGRLYARGASDDKGQFLIHVNALEAHLRTTGSCPVNVKYLIEGEEEIGSPNLEPFIRAQLKQLACDAVVVSDTAMFSKGLPAICHGLRGLTYLEVHVRGTDGDLHSGVFGGAVINPAFALAQMLAALKDRKGRITVPGFYDRVRKLTRSERQAIGRLPHSDAKFRKSIGAPQLYGEAGYSTLERTWTRPTLEINGIWSGFTGAGAKTVLPAQAHAKISARLVPDQTSAEITRKITKYLKRLAPKSVKVEVAELHGGEAWIAPTDDPALQAAAVALQRAFRKKPVFMREGGSIPVVPTFQKMLKVPVVLMGIGLHDDNLHAPNEKLDLDNFYGGNEAAAYLMEELGRNGR
ncbi:MAG TPA: dipeptidase [Candidatus Polarisedimenticolaceae bacterium]|nr:dipeptidase [Candidatus Polarisedimenticolaceae bacterium]